jgi:hypothetical protein
MMPNQTAARISKLGFPVKVMGRDDLKSNDARRFASDPHLKVSLGYLDAILDHLDRHDIRMYRMSSDIAPYATHPDMPQFHGMVRESAAELAAFGAKAKHLGIRLSFHPSQFIVLNSPDPKLVAKSIADLVSQAGDARPDGAAARGRAGCPCRRHVWRRPDRPPALGRYLGDVARTSSAPSRART